MAADATNAYMAMPCRNSQELLENEHDTHTAEVLVSNAPLALLPAGLGFKVSISVCGVIIEFTHVRNVVGISCHDDVVHMCCRCLDVCHGSTVLYRVRFLFC